MRSATVVLPVPGLPVKDMCRLGACACNPRFMRSLSITSSAAISRIRALIGASPIRSCSSSSITAPAWLCESTWFTVRIALASIAGTLDPCAALESAAAAAGCVAPGMVYSGERMSGDPARRRDAAKLDAHRLDHRPVILAAEDRAAGNKGVGAGISHAANVLHFDPAVHFEPDVAAAGVNQLARTFRFAQRRLDEALAAEIGRAH